MAIGLGALEYLAEMGLLTPSTRMLDVGTQNLYNAAPERITAFLRKFGRSLEPLQIEEAAGRISRASIVRPGERTAFLADLLDLTEIDYVGYDVCPAPRTDIFDLNNDHIPRDRRGKFDLVLNFGTTEHVVNQLNAFEVIHDALRLGGVVMHQLPSVGYVDHGYFNYNPLLLNDLAQINRYEVVDRFYTAAGSGGFHSDGLDVRDPDHMNTAHSAGAPQTLPNFNVNYVLRKTVAERFRIGLELRTTHATLAEQVAKNYRDAPQRSAASLIKRKLKFWHG
ncbi:methyltransferase domain-containing protein [Bradyrhizobium sp. STM 3562]|uniref:methyltransferase domain-containing protein n=1 Tax=Bradyrhizobium sp. STM 3562 TaxID=578924 RepID=UPI00388E66F3